MMSSLPTPHIEGAVKGDPEHVSVEAESKEDLEHVTVDTESGIYDIFVQVLNNIDVMN